MFSIRLPRNKKVKPSPHFQNAVNQALRTVIVPKESEADRGYYRPSTSLARAGLNVRAVGKKNTALAGTKYARGTKSTVYSNLKKK